MEEERGCDSEGKGYATVGDLWSEEVGSEEKRQEWYEKGFSYWKGVPATVDGVLGGYGSLSQLDESNSVEFLGEVKSVVGGFQSGSTRALDCGAGVGRITKNVLLDAFKSVDVLEPDHRFITKAKKNLKGKKGIGKFLERGMESFELDVKGYDCIWIQWAIGHLTDDDFVSFMHRCVRSLRPGGIIVVKENISRRGFVLDREDTSVTRSDTHFRDLFERSHLDVVHVHEQKNWPKELFRVYAYALRPKSSE